MASACNSIFDVRRQSELPSSQELKEFGQRNPSVLAKERDTCHCCSWSSKAKAYKNLFGVSISFMIVYSVNLGVASLQSSVNESEGIGLASLTTVYFLFTVSCFYTPSIIRLFGTKYILIVCYIGMTIYTISNYYPHWYTLIPGSVCIGFVSGPLFASINVHVTSVAIQYASSLEENQSNIVALFLGILTAFVKIAYIPGNIISSVILLNAREENTSIIDTSLSDVCNNTEAANLDRLYLYILLSVYVIFDIVAVVLLISFVDRLGTDTRFLSPTRMFELYVKKPFVATLKMMLNWKLILIYPMSILDGFLLAFSLGHFTKFYISDCIGVHWVGFSIAVYGIGSALMAFTVGRLVKYIPQYFVVYTFLTLGLGIVIFLLWWEREPSHFASLLIVFGLGLCGGTWLTTITCLVGILFPHKQEEAFTISRISLAGGIVIGFTFALFLNTQIQLWFALGLIFATFITFSILTCLTQTKSQLFPCCFRHLNN